MAVNPLVGCFVKDCFRNRLGRDSRPSRHQCALCDEPIELDCETWIHYDDEADLACDEATPDGLA